MRGISRRCVVRENQLSGFPMRAIEVMTTDVITVDENTSVTEVANLLARRVEDHMRVRGAYLLS
jgi:CBS domain-containing protein